jgi:titin
MPQIPRASAGPLLSVSLKWQDNSDNESGFYIERSPNGATGWTRVAIVKPNVTTFTNSGLAPNTLYYYRVQAYNAGGLSLCSNRVVAKTKP